MEDNQTVDTSEGPPETVSVFHTTLSNVSQQSSYTDDNKEKNNRRMKLKSAVDKAIQKCTSSMKFRLFAKGYSQVYSKQKSALEVIYKDYQEQLHRSMTQEMALMMEEENVECLLADLSAIISQTPGDQNTAQWRPQGNPRCDVSAHLMPMRLKQCEKLQHILNDLEAHNKKMEAALCARRRQLLETEKETNSTRKTLNEAVESLHRKDC